MSPRKQVLVPPAERVPVKPTLTVEKSFKVVKTPPHNLYEVKYDGGGPVPLPLRGFYTKEQHAWKAVKTYYSRFKGENVPDIFTS